MPYPLSWRRERIELPKVRGRSHNFCVLCLGRQEAMIKRVVYKPVGYAPMVTYQIEPCGERGQILYGGLRDRFFRTKDEAVEEVNTRPYVYQRGSSTDRYGVAIEGAPIGLIETIKTGWIFRVLPGPHAQILELLDCLSFGSIEAFLKVLMAGFSNFEASRGILHAHLGK